MIYCERGLDLGWEWALTHKLLGPDQPSALHFWLSEQIAVVVVGVRCEPH